MVGPRAEPCPSTGCSQGAEGPGVCVDLANPPHLAWRAQPVNGQALSAREHGICSRPAASCTDLSSPSAGLEGDKKSIM